MDFTAATKDSLDPAGRHGGAQAFSAVVVTPGSPLSLAAGDIVVAHYALPFVLATSALSDIVSAVSLDPGSYTGATIPPESIDSSGSVGGAFTHGFLYRADSFQMRYCLARSFAFACPSAITVASFRLIGAYDTQSGGSYLQGSALSVVVHRPVL